MLNNATKKIPLAAAVAAAVLALQGCATAVSQGITDDGKATEVVFPEVDRAWLKKGTFPNLDDLRTVAPGVSKDQLYALLGRPHFREGIGGVREWDYLFHFRSGGGVTTCQYKVVFDKETLAQSFHWKPAGCADLLARQAAPAPAPAPMRQVRLSADALFAFDRSGPADLLPEGQRQLQSLAQELRGMDVERIEVVGHTDRLGPDSYNQRLSQQRAQTVREVLASHGVPQARIVASGRGEHEPVVQCDQTVRTDLIACLAPNRRVDVNVQAMPRR